jgi:hypothetical protein
MELLNGKMTELARRQGLLVESLSKLIADYRQMFLKNLERSIDVEQLLPKFNATAKRDMHQKINPYLLPKETDCSLKQRARFIKLVRGRIVVVHELRNGDLQQTVSIWQIRKLICEQEFEVSGDVSCITSCHEFLFLGTRNS